MLLIITLQKLQINVKSFNTMKRISHLLLVCGFVVVTSNLTACNKIDDVDIYENNTSDIQWNDVADRTLLA